MKYQLGRADTTDPKARAGAFAGDYANNYTEYAVKQRAEGKYFIRRVLLVVLYVVYTFSFAGFFLFGPLRIPMLVALLPVTLWILIFFTWRYASVEHEYMIASGTITFVDIYGGRSRRVLFSCDVKDMMQVAPLPQPYDAVLTGVQSVIDLRGSKDTPDGYFFTVKNNAGKKTAVLFEATEKAVKIMKYYNPVTVVSTSLRR